MMKWSLIFILLFAAGAGGYHIRLPVRTVRAGFVDVMALFNKDRNTSSRKQFLKIQALLKEKMKERFGSDSDVFSFIRTEGVSASRGFAERDEILTAAMDSEMRDMLRLEAETSAAALRDNFTAEYARALRFTESLYDEMKDLSPKTTPDEIRYRLFNMRLKLEVLTSDRFVMSDQEIAAINEKISKLQKLVDEQREQEQREMMMKYESQARAAREEIERKYENQKMAMQKELDERVEELRGELMEQMNALRQETERLAAEKRSFERKMKKHARTDGGVYRDKEQKIEQDEKLLEEFNAGVAREAAGAAREAGVALLIKKPFWARGDVVDCTDFFE
ncbi:MAG: hypothetical protein AB1546_03745 [bacterium]